jgi:Ca2+-dependent lipid-binding protein
MVRPFRWNEEFQLLVHEPDEQQLNLILYDWDVFSSPDEIGRCSSLAAVSVAPWPPHPPCSTLLL